jgi:hypothetical protein
MLASVDLFDDDQPPPIPLPPPSSNNSISTSSHVSLPNFPSNDSSSSSSFISIGGTSAVSESSRTEQSSTPDAAQQLHPQQDHTYSETASPATSPLAVASPSSSSPQASASAQVLGPLFKFWDRDGNGESYMSLLLAEGHLIQYLLCTISNSTCPWLVIHQEACPWLLALICTSLCVQARGHQVLIACNHFVVIQAHGACHNVLLLQAASLLTSFRSSSSSWTSTASQRCRTSSRR